MLLAELILMALYGKKQDKNALKSSCVLLAAALVNAIRGLKVN
jgi:hypothetical protein